MRMTPRAWPFALLRILPSSASAIYWNTISLMADPSHKGCIQQRMEDRVMSPTLITDLLAVLDELSGGVHAGFRPAHAKGLMCAGTFTPSREAAELTRAPHAARPSTAVTVRYSDSTGIPTIPDNDPTRSGPRGMAIRFHLAEHDHTDIVAHSTDGFPVRTGEELLGLVRAVTAFAAGQPEALGSFLAAHPNAKRFVEAPKPIPTSFAREAFFAVTSFKFTNPQGVSRHGRFRIRPDEGTEYSVPWPQGRTEIPFGTITLTGRLDDAEPQRRKIIFDPIPRVDGIDTSG